MSRHRSPRPRYGRIVLALAACAVTVFSVLGGVGIISTTEPVAYGEGPASSLPAAALASPAVAEQAVVGPSVPPAAELARAESAAEALPAKTGQGRRIVYSETAQRVWLVRANGTVRRTYLVSGSTLDNLQPGRYAVYSKSRHAIGIDDSGVMEFFVRFAHGTRAAIGFHTIPTKLGTPLQTRAELGSPQSHGCIRQARADAIALWKFAPEGTRVVVI